MANDLITHHKGEIGKLAAVRHDALREAQGSEPHGCRDRRARGHRRAAGVRPTQEKYREAPRAEDPATIGRPPRRTAHDHPAIEKRRGGRGRPSIPLGPVRSRILAKDLEEAVDHLTDMARQIQDFDMDAMLATGSANLNQESR